MGSIVGAAPTQDPWRPRQLPRQPTPQEIEQLRQLAGRGLQPTPGPEQRPPPPQLPPKPYEYPPLTESQESRAGWMPLVGALTGLSKGGLGGALMGGLNAGDDYRDASLHDNYLEKRLKDPTLTKTQRDALYARRYRQESFSSTYGPFNAYSSAQRTGTRTPMQLPGGDVQDYIRRAGQPDEAWGVPYPRSADQGVKRPTAKDASHYRDIVNARRAILSRSPEQRKDELDQVMTGFADKVLAEQYELARSAGHPDLDRDANVYLQKVYGDQKEWQEPAATEPVAEEPGKLERAMGWAGEQGGKLYDSMTTDAMAPTPSEGRNLHDLERAIERGERSRAEYGTGY